MHLCTKNGQNIHKKNQKHVLNHFTNKCMINNNSHVGQMYLDNKNIRIIFLYLPK